MRVLKRHGDWVIYRRPQPPSPILGSIFLGHNPCAKGSTVGPIVASKPQHICIRCGEPIPDEVWREMQFIQRMDDL